MKVYFLILFCLIIFILSFLIYLYYPLLKLEISYSVNKLENQSVSKIVAVDDDFSIVIPKINANARIIENIDPFNKNDYLTALRKGVAHAKGSSLPSENGNTFIFSHSSVNLIEALKYNSVFYLISKLEKNDNIYLIYKGKKYLYKVESLKIIDPKEIEYINYKSSKKSLVLMTCFPAGTDYKRQIVIANFEGVL